MFETVALNQVRIGDVVVVDGARYRVMFTTLVRGTQIELTIKSTAGRMSPEKKRSFRKHESILKVV